MGRFLKKKIAYALTKLQTESQSDDISTSDANTPSREGENSVQEVSPLRQRRRIPGFSFTPEKVKITKNIVINFGRAISTFVTSHLADTYLKPLAEKEQIDMNKFKDYVKSKKVTIGGISSFRMLLVPSDDDTPEEVAYKKVYGALAEIFMKYFSVNWIFHGRMGHKDVYLKYRFKMLRRIQNPESFTYLLGHKKRKAKSSNKKSKKETHC